MDNEIGNKEFEVELQNMVQRSLKIMWDSTYDVEGDTIAKMKKCYKDVVEGRNNYVRVFRRNQKIIEQVRK